jgi:hypothetical protein
LIKPFVHTVSFCGVDDPTSDRSRFKGLLSNGPDCGLDGDDDSGRGEYSATGELGTTTFLND